MTSGEILKICGSYLHGLHYTICKQNRLVCLEYRELGKNREKRRKFESNSTYFFFFPKFGKWWECFFFPVIILETDILWVLCGIAHCTLYYDVNISNSGKTITSLQGKEISMYAMNLKMWDPNDLRSQGFLLWTLTALRKSIGSWKTACHCIRSWCIFSLQRM